MVHFTDTGDCKSLDIDDSTSVSMADGEDIYDVAPASSETVKDFSKLIGRFDQKQRPNSVMRPLKPVVGLKPVQLPPKKAPVSPGPLSPGAIVSSEMVNSARRQLSLVPNKRESCVRASQCNPAAQQQNAAAPPVLPGKKKAAPPPIAEITEVGESPPPLTGIEQRPPLAVPVASVRPNSGRLSQLGTPGSPSDQYSNDRTSRVSKVSIRSSTYADMPQHYKQLPLPAVNDPPPPKPSRPPHVELPAIDDILSDDIYDDVCQRGPDSRQVSMIPEMLEDEDADPPLPRRQSKEKAGQTSRSVRKPPPMDEEQDVYEEVQQDT